MNTHAHKFNEEKFRELILYISERCGSDPRFGSTKLNKILYFSDFIFFAETGKSITGAEYQRLGNGPAPRQLVPVRKKMESSAELILKQIDYFGKEQKRPIALRAPKMGLFSAEEIASVDKVIEELADDGAVSVSTRSHRHIGWQYARNGETIPYETIFIASIEPFRAPCEK